MASALAIPFVKPVFGKLGDISGYLQAADEQSAHNVSVKRWVAEVRDIRLDAEDIIDECAVEPLYANATQSWVCSYFQLILSSISQLIFQYQMGKRINDLKGRMSSTIQKATELELVQQGFIPQEKGKEQFDIGLNYFHQLENLCLVEVKKAFPRYTVHDLLLELAINISIDYKCDFDLSVNERSCRRLVLSKKGLSTHAISESSLHCQRFLRTISFSQNPEITSIPEQLFDGLRVLRVFDFSHTAISTLPECVGNLKLLKVLNLSHTQIKEVPTCVNRLKSLQFLDASSCTSLERLPDWIGELTSLSHLDVHYCAEGFTNLLPKGISKLLSLRTLRLYSFRLSIEGNKLLSIKDVASLINLQEIRFYLEDEQTLKSVEDGILEYLVKMRDLQVFNRIRATECDTEESTLPAFPKKMNVMKDLQQLLLSRFTVPSWIFGMVNLTKLTLVQCCDYPLLQKMPNLQVMTLSGNSKCTKLPEMFGERGAFPSLVKLDIDDFPLLEELPALEEGAMQLLEYLEIGSCPLVKKLPEGLDQLTTLKRIRLRDDWSGELEERLEEGGEDRNKIRTHNPHIQFQFVVPLLLPCTCSICRTSSSLHLDVDGGEVSSNVDADVDGGEVSSNVDLDMDGGAVSSNVDVDL